MIPIMEVLLTLSVIVVLLQRKISIGNAMLTGAGMLFLMCSPQWITFQAAGRDLLFSSSTWEILAALYLVMCLEYQLRTQGIIDGLMATARVLLKSDKVLLVLMPAFLGFLPSLGGAIFSAPLVEAAGKPYDLSPERKTAINYWFRHLWECTNPILPGLLLASQIAQVSVSVMIAHMLWVSGLCWLLGWLLYISPLRSRVESQVTSSTSSEQGKKYWHLFLAAGPICANFLLVVALDFGPAMSMLLVVITMTLILRLRFNTIINMIHHAFDRKLLWGVVGILFFQYMLKQTGIIADVALVLKSLGISMMIVIGIVGLIAGILTGSSQGYVAITFPLIAAISMGNIDMAVVAYVAGFAGQMLSPAHLCLLVTLDYFKADYLKSLWSVIMMEIAVLVVLSITAIM
ncbi:MAG: integral rane protein [Firmicutes bacterium]|nr:integral rane protein [Bacillota bacterium]